MLLTATQGIAQKIDLSQFDDTGSTNPAPIILISDSTPDPYTHPSTHPKSIADQMEFANDAPHGDGIAKVAFSGKIVEIIPEGDIRPVSGVKFYQLNDNMLLKEKRRIELPFTSDSNGDVAGPVYVFGAYLPLKSDTNNWVVYQTGTAIVSAEVDGFESRVFNIRYRQPSTLIIMRRNKDVQQRARVVREPRDGSRAPQP